MLKSEMKSEPHERVVCFHVHASLSDIHSTAKFMSLKVSSGGSTPIVCRSLHSPFFLLVAVGFKQAKFVGSCQMQHLTDMLGQCHLCEISTEKQEQSKRNDISWQDPKNETSVRCLLPV